MACLLITWLEANLGGVEGLKSSRLKSLGLKSSFSLLRLMLGVKMSCNCLVASSQCTVLKVEGKSSISKISFWYVSAPIWLTIIILKTIYAMYLIANHFEAQKGKLSNLVFSKITAKTWFFTNYDQIPKGPGSHYIWRQLYCLIWCSTAHKPFGITFVPSPYLLNWRTVQCFVEL